jgi:hypothetical protein
MWKDKLHKQNTHKEYRTVITASTNGKQVGGKKQIIDSKENLQKKVDMKATVHRNSNMLNSVQPHTSLYMNSVLSLSLLASSSLLLLMLVMLLQLLVRSLVV